MVDVEQEIDAIEGNNVNKEEEEDEGVEKEKEQKSWVRNLQSKSDVEEQTTADGKHYGPPDADYYKKISAK
ncbi:hypothetical protein AKJ16_DCAP22158 [Drosera capensis]